MELSDPKTKTHMRNKRSRTTQARGSGSLQQPGCAAAPKIIHAFTLDLTKKQSEQLQQIWRDHSEDQGMIIMQPVINWGPFTVTNAYAQCAVLNKECTLMIHKAIDQARQHNVQAQTPPI